MGKTKKDSKDKASIKSTTKKNGNGKQKAAVKSPKISLNHDEIVEMIAKSFEAKDEELDQNDFDRLKKYLKNFKHIDRNRTTVKRAAKKVTPKEEEEEEDDNESVEKDDSEQTKKVNPKMKPSNKNA